MTTQKNDQSDLNMGVGVGVPPNSATGTPMIGEFSKQTKTNNKSLFAMQHEKKVSQQQQILNIAEGVALGVNQIIE